MHDSIYRMAGSFRGVLIFVILMVDLAVMKTSHLQKLMPTVLIVCITSVVLGLFGASLS